MPIHTFRPAAEDVLIEYTLAKLERDTDGLPLEDCEWAAMAGIARVLGHQFGAARFETAANGKGDHTPCETAMELSGLACQVAGMGEGGLQIAQALHAEALRVPGLPPEVRNHLVADGAAPIIAADTARRAALATPRPAQPKPAGVPVAPQITPWVNGRGRDAVALYGSQ